jgi:hypothetical protein
MISGKIYYDPIITPASHVIIGDDPGRRHGFRVGYQDDRVLDARDLRPQAASAGPGPDRTGTEATSQTVAAFEPYRRFNLKFDSIDQ